MSRTIRSPYADQDQDRSYCCNDGTVQVVRKPGLGYVIECQVCNRTYRCS